jgi:hypothetical protein
MRVAERSVESAFLSSARSVCERCMGGALAGSGVLFKRIGRNWQRIGSELAENWQRIWRHRVQGL